MASSATAKDAQACGNLILKRSATGTMVTEAGTSQFYAKHSLIPITDSMLLEDDNRRFSVKLRKLTMLQDGATRFPQLAECAHFHYEYVELGILKLEVDESVELDAQSEHWFLINVTSDGRRWTIRRTYDSLYAMDRQLHRCIYDRKFSRLPELTKDLVEEEGSVRALGKVSAYLTRFSSLANNMINCGPILCWMEMDNKGKRLLVPDSDAAVNIPAIGAAHVVRRYIAQSSDEISLEVGDILSIIDRPLAQETSWWRGKKEFQVGYFPSDHVEMIGSSRMPPLALAETKPVLHKRGKLTSLLIEFFSSRPNRMALRRTGIVKERLFGCDLGEHLLNSGQDVPLVLKCCAEVLESHGIVDGIYRLSGVASNIQKLRNEFDEDHIPVLTTDMYLQDIHCISSLVKMYFRELPNPLFTYQLYDKFTHAINEASDEIKLIQLREIVRQLPPPHYRTAEFLLRHLCHMASYHLETSMHYKNLAIVWAPNLLRSKDLEQTTCSSVAALKGAGLQAVVTEFLIANVNDIFNDDYSQNSGLQDYASLLRPKSLCPTSSSASSSSLMAAAKLLSLEEAQERALGEVSLRRQKYISVGGGPAALPAMYHTIIELPRDKKRNAKRTVPTWRALFARNHSMTLPSIDKDATVAQGDLLEDKRRSVSYDRIDGSCSDLLLPSNSEDFSGGSTVLKKSLQNVDIYSLPSFEQNLSKDLHQDKSFQATPAVMHSITTPDLPTPELPPKSKTRSVCRKSSSRFSHGSADPRTDISANADILQMPSGSLSVSSFDSYELLMSENVFKTANFNDGKEYQDLTSLNKKQSFDDNKVMLSGTDDQHRDSSSSELSEFKATKKHKKHVTGCDDVSHDCFLDAELVGPSVMSEQANRSLADEQEFLSWKLSASQMSKDLLSELSPALNRFMPRSSFSTSSLDCSEMYDSCQSLNVFIPVPCDIGSIPENIGGSDSEKCNDQLKYSSLHSYFSALNVHSIPVSESKDYSDTDTNLVSPKKFLKNNESATQSSMIHENELFRGELLSNPNFPKGSLDQNSHQSMSFSLNKKTEMDLLDISCSPDSPSSHFKVQSQLNLKEFGTASSKSETVMSEDDVSKKAFKESSVFSSSPRLGAVLSKKKPDTPLEFERCSDPSKSAGTLDNSGICQASSKRRSFILGRSTSVDGNQIKNVRTSFSKEPNMAEMEISQHHESVGVPPSSKSASLSTSSSSRKAKTNKPNITELGTEAETEPVPAVERPGHMSHRNSCLQKRPDLACCHRKEHERHAQRKPLQSREASKQELEDLMSSFYSGALSGFTDNFLDAKARTEQSSTAAAAAQGIDCTLSASDLSSSFSSLSSSSSSLAKMQHFERKQSADVRKTAASPSYFVSSWPSPSTLSSNDQSSGILPLSCGSASTKFFETDPFSDFEMSAQSTETGDQITNNESDSALYAELLHRKATKLEPSEMLRKSSTPGTYVMRTSAVGKFH